MSFGIGVLCYVVGTIIIAVCLAAIPGPSGAAEGSHADHGHGHGHPGH